MAVSAAPAHAGPDLTKPFTRELVKRGDVDADQYNIEHVYEVQIRLRRLGFLSASPNGTFGPLTERAVKRFQRDRGLRVTGQVGAKTWKPLIFRSTFGRAKVPARCRTPAGASATTGSAIRRASTTTAPSTTRGWSAGELRPPDPCR